MTRWTVKRCAGLGALMLALVACGEAPDGANGTSTTTDGSAGSAGGVASCGGGCAEGEACFGGACQAPQTIVVATLAEDVESSPSGTTKRLHATACSYAAVEAVQPGGDVGSCSVVTGDDIVNPAAWGGDVGTLALSSASLGTTMLAVGLGDDAPCADVDLPSSAALVAGETVSFSVQGSASFPAIAETIAIPEALAITTDVYTPGAALDLAWTGTSAGSIFALVGTFSDAQSSFVQCELPDTGSFTIPASLMAELDQGAPAASLVLLRSARARALSEVEPVALEVHVSRADSRIFVTSP
jgi:hypothetical protein